MVEGYSTFADSGEWKPVRSIQRITDKNGAVLYEAEPIDVSEQVLDPRIAYLLTSILSDVSARPNEYWQTVLTVPGFQTAAKTGTSNKCIERMSTKTGATRTGTPSCKERKPDNLWTIGYTPNLVAGVWVGNASGEPLFEKAESLTTAAPIWRDFMIKAHKRIENPTVSFSIPEGIVQPQISLLSGELPTECTPIELRKADLFLEEKPPTREDPACVQLLVDKVTGLLASDDCPKEAQEMQSFLIPRSILAERWPTWEEGVQKWSKKQMELWKATPTHSGSLLSLPAAPTEKCDPTLTPGRLVKPTLSILYPDDGGTATYPSFQAKLKFKVGSSVREITYALDGKKLVTAGSGDTLEPVLRVPRSIEEEGSHTLTVTLVDQYFNSVSDEVTFRFGRDKNPPQVRITIPREGAVFREGQKLTIRAEAGDDEGGIKHIQFLLDDLLLTTKPQEPYELTYVLKAMNAGPHTIRAKATDLAGNTAEDRVTITVE
jgi:membrane carboxypeptidase/penicillin-binding protein PbpC